jgi:hypothetical protein
VRRSDIYSGIVLALTALATIFFVVPPQIAVSEEYGLNPRIFPLTVLWLGFGVALILVAARLREPAAADEEPAHMQPKNWLFIAAMSAFLAASYFAIDLLGFMLAAPATLALLMLAMGEYRHPVRLAIVSAALPAAIYYSFDRLFAIQLP